MSRSMHMETYFDGLVAVFTVVDEVLNAWTEESCYQLPMLLGNVKLKMGWDDKQLRAHDPLIRHYIHNHVEWTIARGASGGAVRKSVLQKKEAARLAKSQAKIDAALAIEAAITKKREDAQKTETTTPATDEVSQ